MNIDFNILWFEDNNEWFTSFSEIVEDYLKTHSFIPVIKRCTSVNENEISEILDENEFDLILADLDLEIGQGKDAIKIIRSKDVLADILYYSSHRKEAILENVKHEHLEGVYLEHRDLNGIIIRRKVETLIDKVIRRSENVLNIRGMMMDNVSEFDYKLKSIIIRFLQPESDNEVAYNDKVSELNTYAYDKVSKQLISNTKTTEKFKDNGFIKNALENPFLLDSAKLSMLVNHIFSKYYPDEKEMKNFYIEYLADIIKERNNLAHAKSDPNNNGIFSFISKTDGSEIIYDSTKCHEIRSNLLKFHSKLDNALKIINQ